MWHPAQRANEGWQSFKYKYLNDELGKVNTLEVVDIWKESTIASAKREIEREREGDRERRREGGGGGRREREVEGRGREKESSKAWNQYFSSIVFYLYNNSIKLVTIHSLHFTNEEKDTN